MSSASSHLSYPASQSDPSTSTSLPQPPPQRELLKNRLYVGNLHPTVDEYTLIQVFSKFGKLVRVDYLFHKTGALRGKPRGYAFVEYLNDHVSALAHPLAARDEEIRKTLCSPRVYSFFLYMILRLCVPHVSFSLHTFADPGYPPWRQVMNYAWVLDADASEYGACRMLLPRLQLRMGRF